MNNYSNTSIMHAFAQQYETEGKTSNGNVFFNDNKIYSYGHHYLLGEFIDSNTILINNEGYGNTTAKHIYILSGATSQYKQFFTEFSLIDPVHYTVKDCVDKLAKARKPEIYINTILGLFESMTEYYTYTKKGYKSNPKYKEIKRIVDALNNNTDEYKAKLKEVAIKQAKTKAKKDAKELKVKLAEFLAYEINYFRVGDYDYLRLSEDGAQVESSQGVKVSVENALILYKAILAGVDISGHRIEHYTVTSINGTLIIGCHNINMDSLHKVGKQIV